MPQAIAGWIATAFSVQTGTLAYAAIQAGVGLAFSYAASKINQPKGPENTESEIRQSDAPMIRHLGLVRASGAVHYWEVHDDSLWKLIAVAAGGHSGVQQWYADNKKLTVNGAGLVTNEFDGRVRLWNRTGRGALLAGGQYPELLAASPFWTAQHDLFEVGTFLAKMDCVAAEDVPDIYPGGEPEISAVIFGDVQRYPGGAAVGHSTSLARQLYDILTHPKYGPLDDSEIDVASWVNAITIGNQQVPTAGGTRARYGGGGSYALNEPIKDVAARWCDAMAADLYLTTDGKVGIHPGIWVEPEYTIRAEHIVSMEFSAMPEELDGVAGLVPSFTSPELDYQTTTADAVIYPAAAARWGDDALKDLQLPNVQHFGQAASVARINLAKLNPKFVFNISLRFWGLLLLEERTVTLDLPHLGINNEPFWIEEYSFNPMGGDGVCQVTLKHADPDSFTISVSTEGTAPRVPPQTATGITAETPTISGVSVVRTGGVAYIRVIMPSSGSTIRLVRPYIVEYRKTGETGAWSRASEADDGSFRTDILDDNTAYDVRAARVRFQYSDTPISDWAYANNVLVQYNTTPPGVPTIVSSSGAAGSGLTVTFSPALGPNYSRTELWRNTNSAGAFTGASYLKHSFAQQDQVTITASVPAGGAAYWLVSVNASGVQAAPVLVGRYS